jgi:serine/threonine protein kinase
VFLGRPCNEKIDIYALGVVLWEICTHEMPVRGRMREIRVPEECPREIFDLINACLAESPDGRPSAKEVHRSIKMWRHKWMLAIRAKYDSPPQLERRSSVDSMRRSSDSADGSILLSNTSSEMRSGPRRSSSLGNSGEHLMTAHSTDSRTHDHRRPDEIADADIDGEDNILYRSGESVQQEVEDSLLQRPQPTDWKRGGDDAMHTIREEQSAAGIPKDSQYSMFAQMAAQMKPFDDESSEGSEHVSEDKTPTHDSANSTVAHAIDVMDGSQTRHKLSGDKSNS